MCLDNDSCIKANFQRLLPHSKVKMRSVVIFALVLLAIIATIDAQCKGKYKGKVYKLKKVPRSCCKKNGRLSVSKSGKPSRWGRSLVVRQANKGCLQKKSLYKETLSLIGGRGSENYLECPYLKLAFTRDIFS